jgi:hypothetical protein
MSMILCLKRISDGDVERLRATSSGVRAFIDADVPEPDYGPEYAAARAALLKQMAAAGMGRPARTEIAFDSYPFNDIFDIDKMWHGVYFLLTGTEYGGEPPVNLLFQAPPVGNEDIGYGPALAISADQTKALSDHLAGLQKAVVLARFDGARMKALKIYPDIWDEDPAQLKEELGNAFDALRAYCRRCADHGLGMLSYVS